MDGLAGSTKVANHRGVPAIAGRRVLYTMHRRLLSIGLLASLVPFAPAGAGGAFRTPVLPEVKQHLADGWACVSSNPNMARAHAMAVLVSENLSVQIELDQVPASRRTACRTAIDDALQAWEKALGDGIRLRRLEDGQKSGIVVRFKPDVRERGEPVAGYVNWKRVAGKDGGSVTGDIQVRTMNIDGAPMSGRAMKNIVVHEMGHMLGLDDTDRRGEAMSPLDPNRPVSAPSDDEANAVRSLRLEATNLLNDAR